MHENDLLMKRGEGQMRNLGCCRRKPRISVAAFLFLSMAMPLASPAVAQSLTVRFAPADYVYAQKVKRPGLGYRGVSPYYDLMLQSVAFVNSSPRAVTLEGGVIEILRGGDVVQSQMIDPADIENDLALIAQLRGMEFDSALDVLLSAGELLNGVEVSSTLELKPNSAAVASQFYFVLRGLPDSVRVRIHGKDDRGDRVEGGATLAVRQFESKNEYRFPLEAGAWYVTSYPDVKGHHRWTPSTEFALDIVMLDSRGSIYSGNAPQYSVKSWDQFYGYNKKVLAAADGKVVKVVDTVEFPLDVWRRQDGESRADYEQRAGQMQMKLFLAEGADPITVAGGNHVVIEHAGGEYSFYGHLAYDGIRVKKGDVVKRGQHIAGLGGTGERPYAHLHFQLYDRADSLFGHSLPVGFGNAAINHPAAELSPEVFEPGYFVIVE